MKIFKGINLFSNFVVNTLVTVSEIFCLKSHFSLHMGNLYGKLYSCVVCNLYRFVKDVHQKIDSA